MNVGKLQDYKITRLQVIRMDPFGTKLQDSNGECWILDTDMETLRHLDSIGTGCRTVLITDHKLPFAD